MKTECLRAAGIWVDSDRVSSLREFGIILYSGEITGMLGLVGSGITVVADALSGRKKLEKGQIYMDHTPVQIRGMAQAEKMGIYVISEKTIFLDDLRLEENLCLSQRQESMGITFPSEKQISRIRRCMEELKIQLKLKEYPKKLGSLECHLAEILRAYLMGCRILILNHIANRYTRKELEKLKDVLDLLKEKGIAILLLESSCERVCKGTDSLYVLRGGRVEGIFERKEYDPGKIKRVMLGDYEIPDTQKTQFFYENDKTLLLEARGLESTAFKELCFQVEKGEVIGFWEEENGICQPLLKVLWGEEKTVKGSLWLGEKKLKPGCGHSDFVKQGIGYVESGMQGLFPGLTMAKNLTISSIGRMSVGGRIRGGLEKAIVADAAGQMGIAVKELEKSAAEADSREKLMISIYRWILNRCQVIIFHNVLEGADLLMRDGMVEVINLAHKKGLGFLLFSSNKKELYELCDHIYILNRGQIVEELRK